MGEGERRLVDDVLLDDVPNVCPDAVDLRLANFPLVLCFEIVERVRRVYFSVAIGVGTELAEDVAWVGGEADGWADGNVDRFGLGAKPPVLATHNGSAGTRSGSREAIRHYPSVKEECGE